MADVGSELAKLNLPNNVFRVQMDETESLAEDYLVVVLVFHPNQIVLLLK